MPRRILVTAALPYANGPIHIGHLVEYIQTDIWARFQKMRGHDCVYCCADDTHGTPIMLRARQEQISPKELIERMYAEHVRDFLGFDIAFDSYYSTHSKENRICSEMIYERLKQGGHIAVREVEQAFCEHDRMFLPDRFIRGTCPKCGAADQYGDSCEVCHATYSPLDLRDARCSTCGQPPQQRRSKHYFFQLGDFTDRLKDWITGGRVHAQVQNKLGEWFDQGLRDWDISRDAPYFGFLIPGEKDKYFYVWLDAPIGYIASTMNYCKQAGRNYQEYWCDPATEIHHFIGKDITYFHALFWPAMLMGARLNTPDRLTIHGFLTVNGEKMSKSRGTFVMAATYLKYLDINYLRYYYASKLGPGTEDIDLNLEDFVRRINSDLVGNFANLASRSITMLRKSLKGRLGKLTEEARAMLKGIQGESDEVNRYIDRRKPWAAIKTDPEHARQTLTASINAVRLLTIFLKPILPGFAGRMEKIMQIEPLQWSDTLVLLEDREVGEFERLIERVDPRKVEMMIEESKETQPQAASGPTELEKEPLAEEIDFEQFMKVDLRVGKVLKAEIVEGADKLLRFEVDLGGRTRNILGAFRQAYQPEEMEGKLVVVAANLASRKMRFGLSEGMIMASGTGDKDVFALWVDEGAKPGQRIH